MITLRSRRDNNAAPPTSATTREKTAEKLTDYLPDLCTVAAPPHQIVCDIFPRE